MDLESRIDTHEAPAVSEKSCVPKLLDILTERQHDYGEGGTVELVRQALTEALRNVGQQIDLLTTKQAIAERNFCIDSEEVQHKQHQRDAQFLSQNPELLAQHERRIDELLRSMGVLAMQLRRIAERIEQSRLVAAQLQARIEACDAQKNRFHEIAMGQASLLLDALSSIEPADAFANESIDVVDDELFADIVARPSSLAGDRIIIDIVNRSMQERTASNVDHHDAVTQILHPLGVVMPGLDDEELFGK